MYSTQNLVPKKVSFHSKDENNRMDKLNLVKMDSKESNKTPLSASEFVLFKHLKVANYSSVMLFILIYTGFQSSYFRTQNLQESCKILYSFQMVR